MRRYWHFAASPQRMCSCQLFSFCHKKYSFYSYHRNFLETSFMPVSEVFSILCGHDHVTHSIHWYILCFIVSVTLCGNQCILKFVVHCHNLKSTFLSNYLVIECAALDVSECALIDCARFEVLTVMTWKLLLFGVWNYNLVAICRQFGRTCCLHFWGYQSA
jgi:hypothetical protein